MNQPVISCRGVWKLFGENPAGYLAKLSPQATFDEIRDAGYIAAVRDVSLEIPRNELLVVMGLSGSGKSTLVHGDSLGQFSDRTNG